MASEKNGTLQKLFSNKFILGMLTGFAIGMATKNLIVGIALVVVLTLAWYSAAKKKKEEAEEVV